MVADLTEIVIILGRSFLNKIHIKNALNLTIQRNGSFVQRSRIPDRVSVLTGIQGVVDGAQIIPSRCKVRKRLLVNKVDQHQVRRVFRTWVRRCLCEVPSVFREDDSQTTMSESVHEQAYYLDKDGSTYNSRCQST